MFHLGLTDLKRKKSYRILPNTTVFTQYSLLELIYTSIPFDLQYKQPSDVFEIRLYGQCACYYLPYAHCKMPKFIQLTFDRIFTHFRAQDAHQSIHFVIIHEELISTWLIILGHLSRMDIDITKCLSKFR